MVAALDIDWSTVPFNEASDAALARELGCSRKTVGVYRRRLGFDVYSPPDLTNEVLKTVVDLAWEAHRVTETMVARAADKKVRSVSNALDRLADRGLVEMWRPKGQTRGWFYRPTREGLKEYVWRQT